MRRSHRILRPGFQQLLVVFASRNHRAWKWDLAHSPRGRRLAHNSRLSRRRRRRSTAFAVDIRRPVVEELAPPHFRAPRNPGSLLEVRFPPAQKQPVRKVRPRPAPLRRISWHVVVGHVLPTTDAESCGQLHRLWRALCARFDSCSCCCRCAGCQDLARRADLGPWLALLRPSARSGCSGRGPKGSVAIIAVSIRVGGKHDEKIGQARRPARCKSLVLGGGFSHHHSH